MKLFLLLLVIISPQIFAESHAPTRAEVRDTAWANWHAERTLHRLPNPAGKIAPYVEFEPAAHVMFSDGESYEAGTIKAGIAKNLPAGVKLVVTSSTPQGAANARARFSQYLPADRLSTVVVPEGNIFWARDTSPLPIRMGELEPFALGLVRTLHRGGDKIAPKIAGFFAVPELPSNFSYPGGNFMADDKGNCFQVASPRGYLSAQAMTQLYGCKNTISFTHYHGIGDVDEVVKIVSPKIALTNEPAYRAELERLGYEVRSLPRPTGYRMGTYANSLLVNGTVFLPTYQVAEDAQAIARYQELGFTVVPLPSRSLSTYMLGSIHCMTMAYP